MDFHELGPVLGDLRQWDPEEDGAVSESGREARVGLRFFTKTAGHQGLWRPMSRVGYWALVTLLQNLWEGLQETTAAMQNPNWASAPESPLHWLAQTTGAGLL